VLLAAAVGTSLWAFFAEASSAYRPWPVLGLWLASIALFLLGVLCFDEGRRKLGRLSIPRWEWAAIGVLTVIALLVRVIAMGHVPHNCSGDEGAMGLQARAVLEGRLRDPFTSGWLSHPTLWFYVQAASLRVCSTGSSDCSAGSSRGCCAGPPWLLHASWSASPPGA
jgi:hypothetical protein